ncbi:aldose 1-epimerase family protein [Pseudarthrobacter sp. AL07]|uniref:aldose 1-epimerase family protein n=1 Tax=unclassified Pseudarthrobacter TaxID=2647000 RepID=UPI00249AEBE1|nr:MULTISPECIES: aldose 1-epimerase family protein [unclassified Pseudarthrobacter]MDI3195538.1 aldose 1-epimerase family protein [Pseudarthrobacter sp. AL20]MDI3209624.1 aldose 1-epimerase family protein [Pseudarthrobacter sp. AL07]
MNGAEYGLRHGPYTALITARGAAVRVLQHRGRDLVVPFPAGGPNPHFRGVVVAPWPNRIPDGKYTFNGVDYRVPVNEPDRESALHGFTPELDWTLEARTENTLGLSCRIEPTPGYPFALSITACYRLDGDGLHTAVTAANAGERTAPYGVCPHPYLRAGPAPLDEWSLEVPAGRFLEVTPDRLLPLATRPVAGHAYDFRTARVIGSTAIDNAFTDIAFDGGGRASVVVRDPGGTGVGMAWDRSCPWLQIHTADKEHPSPNRLGLAVEPMTCPPDAFNSGQHLVQLQPGASHEASWSIYAS